MSAMESLWDLLARCWHLRFGIVRTTLYSVGHCDPAESDQTCTHWFPPLLGHNWSVELGALGVDEIVVAKNVHCALRRS